MSPHPPISLWMDQLAQPLTPRPALQGRLEVDVAIIGAGYTGLWTAYYLKRQAPELRIAVVEAEYAGFGASGRNGGWLMGNLFGELFPQLRNVAISHGWGGNLGMARRFQPHMLLDRANRIALSGGYGGEGVGASNLGGRTLADLILGRSSQLTRQPWVLGERPLSALKAWEPEPCRWLGYTAIMHSFAAEDRVLANPHSPAWRRALAARLADLLEGLMR